MKRCDFCQKNTVIFYIISAHKKIFSNLLTFTLDYVIIFLSFEYDLHPLRLTERVDYHRETKEKFFADRLGTLISS